jgi:Immunity protein 74
VAATLVPPRLTNRVCYSKRRASLRPNLYESFDGFSVEVLGRTGLRYCEGGRQMFVDSEVLTGPSGMAVYKGTIQKWDPPYDNVPVTHSDRDRILNNIRDAVRSQGFEMNVI